MAESAAADEGKKAKSAMMATIAIVAVLSLVGAGGGWVIGGMLAPKVEAKKAEVEARKEADAHAAPDDSEHAGEGAAKVQTALFPIDAVTTNLSYPSDNWIRLEVSLEFNGPVDERLARDIHQDMLSYLRTVSLQQIEGPRGFQYLREDLRERVRLRSEGRVNDLLFRTFVIE